ncbi:ArsR/SmtB family transcription factor [Gracilibacillus boraciitolerans]|nr:metalloregulator ArsR/SmtB family transcription factor [Gracilibacillus boraciitolerans]
MITTTMEIEKSALVLKLLGDKTRLIMMKLLEKNTCCVCEFVEIFQVSQSSISQHLRKLRDADLVKEERHGQWIYYSLLKDHEYFNLIEQILKQLPSQDYLLRELEQKGMRISC